MQMFVSSSKCCDAPGVQNRCPRSTLSVSFSSFLDGDVHCSLTYCVFISQFIRFVYKFFTLLTNISIEANSVDPDQTAPIGAV